MTPARKTSGILILAAALAAAAFLFTAQRSRTRAAPLGPGVANGAGLVLAAHLPSTYVLEGTHETHLAVTLTAPENKATKRPRVNIAVVIDRSGSMAGEPLAHAKKAARQLISQLREGDRFSVIAYGSDVDVVFASSVATESNKSGALAAIDRIYDDGGTNLSGGLMTGRGQVLSNPSPGAVSRIVLISDGQANEGIIHREELARLARETAQQGISITTVGVGLDFDERTMTNIAVAGRGNYYFVESSARLAEMFASELGRLGATAATEVRLAITPEAGVEILEAYGYPMYREGGAVRVPVADLHAGEVRKVVLRIRVSANQLGAINLARVQTTFKPIDKMELTRVNVVARAEVTRSARVVLEHRDKNAVGHIERARTARAIEKATSLYEQGQRSAANKLLKDRAEASAKVAEEVGDDDLRQQLVGATQKAKKRIKRAARPSTRGGKRALKGNRADSYNLFH
jgi:Ca-activated chloride channel family protein